MSTKALASLLGAAVAVVSVVVFAVIRSPRQPGRPSPAPSVSPAIGEQSATSKTRLDVPANTVVPDPSSTVDSNVAKPVRVSSEEPTSDSKLRVFRIQINNDQFTPDTIIVRVKDEADITFVAVDKTYDFVQPDNGYQGTVGKGTAKVLAGRFYAPGKYILYCSSCGGPTKGPVGYIVVVPQ